MPRAGKDFQTTFRVKRGWTAIARVENPDGQNIVPGTITSIQCVVRRANKSPDPKTLDQSLTVASVVFTELQTSDSRWAKDNVGYNFLYEVPGSAFDVAGAHYVVEFVFTPTTGEKYSVIYEGSAKSTYNA